jgi:hypothetical protein
VNARVILSINLHLIFFAMLLHRLKKRNPEAPTDSISLFSKVFLWSPSRRALLPITQPNFLRLDSNEYLSKLIPAGSLITRVLMNVVLYTLIPKNDEDETAIND